MKKEYCKDCVCLIEGNNEKWVCDEKGVEISKIKRCPETGELEEEEDKKKIMSVINLNEINDTQGIIDAFDKLNERAIALGTPICLNTETSTSLVLYFHDDYQDRILVDKYLSNLKRKCPRCGSILAPSDVEGYAYVCHECDENFCHFEVDETEEWRGSNVMMVSD